VYNIIQHSTGFILIRSLDIPSSHRGEARFEKLLMVFPGPKEPEKLQPYLADMPEDFVRFGPNGESSAGTPKASLTCLRNGWKGLVIGGISEDLFLFLLGICRARHLPLENGKSLVSISCNSSPRKVTVLKLFSKRL
jgi:hypothetical protein